MLRSMGLLSFRVLLVALWWNKRTSLKVLIFSFIRWLFFFFFFLIKLLTVRRIFFGSLDLRRPRSPSPAPAPLVVVPSAGPPAPAAEAAPAAHAAPPVSAVEAGTRPFWKSKRHNLLAYAKNLGCPHLFLTLSAADYHWHDLMRH